ncbi:hypothetical protein [Mycolicibacterium sp. J2]|uniref:hypothetical protein n=1 Tax=Mycolicibacterium sp. J2 TaxID=2993511 RepID=UPI00224A6CF7|nr:hypothetical protein [Mycolicibacterium sp. J2]MCX2711281.1 hypothetical protein [Mycolicibacterium sp. J2]
MAIDADAAEPEVTNQRNPVRIALVVGLTAMVGLVGVAGWLGFRAYGTHRDEQRQAIYLQVARQGAVNLTTIDHREVEADVKRILDSATGPFYDDFSSRAQPFIDVVKKAQSTSVGTVVSAGIESETDHDAQVLVAVSVKTTATDGSDQLTALTEIPH